MKRFLLSAVSFLSTYNCLGGTYPTANLGYQTYQGTNIIPQPNYYQTTPQIQNNYIIQQVPVYVRNTMLSIAQNRDIKNYVKGMALFGYNNYWGGKLDKLMTGQTQKNTAIAHLNSYYTYEKNKYDNYMYYYNSLESTTHWYNYIFNKPAALIYKALAKETLGDINDLNKIYNVIVY